MAAAAYDQAYMPCCRVVHASWGQRACPLEGGRKPEIREREREKEREEEICRGRVLRIGESKAVYKGDKQMKRGV
jgi:hypothetical protein